MQEVALSDQTEALAHADPIAAGDFDALVLLTGVGFKMLFDVVASRHPASHLIEVLAQKELICRGPKPVAVLKGLGLQPTLVAPEPNTWRELLGVLDERDHSLVGKRVLVQEYGVRNEELLAGLRDRGARVDAVPIYAWRLPDDTGPLKQAVSLLCEDGADVLLLTSQQQLQHLLSVAESEGRREALLQALRARVVVASVGPITTEALNAHNIPVDLEPEHPKMGHLVAHLAAEGGRALSDKRGTAPSS